MIDGIIKADGTSRLMRANLPATYEEFKAQAAAGTLPLDVLFNADGWSQIPTFLNKANLLKDSTANVFGLGANAVPDDVFGVLSRFHNGLGNEYVWEKVGGANEAVYDSVTNHTSASQATKLFNKNDPTTFYLADSLEDVLFGNYQEITITPTNATACKAVNGKYLRIKEVLENSNVSGSDVYFVPSGATWTKFDDPYGFASNKVTQYVGARVEFNATSVSYVNSPNPNAYPVDDGFTYTALGQLGAKVQIATGSYTGTGTYGASNPNSIAFDFEPKLVFLVAETGGINNSELYPAAIGARYTTVPFYLLKNTYIQNWGFSSNASYIPYGKRDGNTMYWYVEKSASYQFNNSGATYHWLAIG